MLQTVLTDATLVPLGVAVTAAVAILVLVWRVSAKTEQVLARLTAIEAQLRIQWTRSDQIEWVVTLRDANPQLKIPLPKFHTVNP